MTNEQTHHNRMQMGTSLCELWLVGFCHQKEKKKPFVNFWFFPYSARLTLQDQSVESKSAEPNSSVQANITLVCEKFKACVCVCVC